MKLSIEKNAFLKPLGHVQSIVEKRNTVPILANVQLEAKDGMLFIRATDMDMEVVESVAASIETAGAITVSAQMLYDIIRKFPDGADVNISLKDDRLRLDIKAGKSAFSLATLPAEDFPTLHVDALEKTFNISKDDLSKMIDKTRFAMSVEETRYYLNGIYLHATESDGKSVLRAVATDGHRLARYDAPLPKGAEDLPGVILPRKMVGELRKLVDAEESIKVSLSDTIVKFEFGTVVLTSKLIDGTFPDYNRVIPAGNDKTLDVNCESFSTAVDRVAILSTEKAKAVKVLLNSGKIIVSASSPDAGSAEEELEASYDNEELSIGFNAGYLLDIAGQIEGDDLHLSFADSASPVILTELKDDKALYVLMPMRV
ncbi:MAG: DNA polymerase III subunit beta [Alphaproteobacteria bacterium]